MCSNTTVSTCTEIITKYVFAGKPERSLDPVKEWTELKARHY